MKIKDIGGITINAYRENSDGIYVKVTHTDTGISSEGTHKNKQKLIELLVEDLSNKLHQYGYIFCAGCLSFKEPSQYFLKDDATNVYHPLCRSCHDQFIFNSYYKLVPFDSNVDDLVMIGYHEYIAGGGLIPGGGDGTKYTTPPERNPIVKNDSNKRTSEI